MPSKKECAAKFPKGSAAYKKCVTYKDQKPKPRPQQGPLNAGKRDQA